MTTRNLAASVRARLLNKARVDGVDFQLPLEKRTPVRDIQAVGTAAGAIWNPIAAARRLSDAMLRWRCISS